MPEDNKKIPLNKKEKKDPGGYEIEHCYIFFYKNVIYDIFYYGGEDGLCVADTMDIQIMAMASFVQ